MEFAPEQVVVTNGAKQALFNALSTCTDPGDRVGVLAPYWVTYAEVARALGCEPVMIECPASLRFRPDPDALEAALHEGLRVLIVNSPGNPTGAAYRSEDFASILAAVAETDTLLISDEIYEEIVFVDGGHVSPLHVRPDLVDRICVITGFSKAFAMTGWRVGFSLAPLDWSKAMGALQGHVTSNVNAVAQQAALTALTRRDLVAPMVEVFHRRRDRVTEQIAGTPGLSAMEPEGTFYSFMDVSALLGDTGYAADVDALCARLLDEHKVVVVPGTAFGNDHHARLSFAASDADLDGAFERLRVAFS